LVVLVGVVGVAVVSCSGSGGSGSPGTGGGGGATGGNGAAGTGGSSGGAAGTTGAAGVSGAGGTAATAGMTGTGGASGTGGATAGSTGAAGTAGGARGGTTGGAGTTGAGGSGGGANACATALFCDDFEKYTVGAAPNGNWTRQVSSGSTAAVDNTKSSSGSQSVKFVAAAGSGSKTAYIRLAGSSIFPVSPNVVYGRMMFYLDAAPTGDVHWTFLEGSGLIAGQSYHALYRYGGQHPVMSGSTFVGSQLMANYETPDSYGGNGPSSDCWKHASAVVVPAAKWSCVEWQFDGPNNGMRFWLDGAPVDSLTVTGAGSGCVNQSASYVWTAPTFDRIDLGWESYQQDTARTIWIDDVVVSKTKVGCP
jgi:hypothetical protein